MKPLKKLVRLVYGTKISLISCINYTLTLFISATKKSIIET